MTNVTAPATPPIYMGNAQNADHGQSYQTEILDLRSTGQLRITEADGTEFVIPGKYLSALHQATSTGLAQSELTENIGHLRARYHGDFEKMGLKLDPDHRGYKLVRTNDAPKALGTPALIWDKDTTGSYNSYRTYNTPLGTNTGWTLVLTGAETVPLGYAQWDDLPAFENLLTIMGNQENLINMGALIGDPKGEIAALTSRIVVRELWTQGALPPREDYNINTTLTDANLLSPAGIQLDHRGRTRVLEIKTGDHNIPVALGVAAPHILDRPVTKEERDTLSPEKLRQLKIKLAKNNIRSWYPNARQTLLNTGWREVNLPQAKLTWKEDHPMLWVTKMPQNLWDAVEAAAKESTRDFYMGAESKEIEYF